MLAVMGPSGCGKTTMLDTLAGRMRGNIKTSGILAVNGHGISLAFGKAAYVAQESQLAGALTVRETLLFAARIRLAGLSKKEMEDIVDRILEDMGLTIVSAPAPAASRPKVSPAMVFVLGAALGTVGDARRTVMPWP